MAVYRLFNDRQQFFDDSGVTLSGGLLFFYLAGSSTKQATYSDNLGTVPNVNPIVLDAAGRPTTEIWLSSGIAYKLILSPSTDSDPPTSPIWTEDTISGIDDAAFLFNQTEWPTNSLVPTYISATSFSFPGDQTVLFTAGRALQIVDAGGTKYGWIKTSTFGAGITTIVLDQNSAALASPMTSVAFGILQGTANSSEPILPDTFSLRGGSADRSKQVRIEADGITTATTRVWTATDRDVTVGGFLAAPQSASGTSVDFTGIPAGTRRICITFVGISTNGTSNLIIQIGDSGGIETSGYLGAGTVLSNTAVVTAANFTTGFGFPVGAAANVLHGSVLLILDNASSNTWTANGNLGFSSTAAMSTTAGSKATSAVLDRVRITTVGGADTFDAGEFNIFYE